MNWPVVNAALNIASIIAWLWVFYMMLSRGAIVTRRENTLTLSLKDQIIETQSETIRVLKEENEELREVGGLLKDFVASVREELDADRKAGR